MEKIQGFQTIRERNCTDEITKDVTVYSTSEVENKYPNYIDGLKTINRRIIWASRDKTKPDAMVRMIGEVMVLHTSGDQSIEDAIKRLSQPFKHVQPLITIEGKNGAYYDAAGAAAARYLKAGLSPFSYDVFYKDINMRTIPMKANKDYTIIEPKYLIPKIPMALLTYNLTIGYGFKSVTSMMDIDSVCDLVIAYASDAIDSASGVAPAYKYGKMLIPSFPTKCLIRNTEELTQAYSNDVWDTPIRMDGVVELSGEAITLRSIPYQDDFRDATDKFREKLKSKDGKYLTPFIKSARSLSAIEAEFDIPLVKGKNPFATLDMIRPLLKLSDPIHPSYVYTNAEGKLIQLTPLKILALWYNERRNSIIGSLKYKQARLIDEERRIRAILLICDYKDEVIDLIKNAETDEEAIRHLHTRFAKIKLSWQQATIIVDQKIRILARANKQKLNEELENNKREQNDNFAKFGKINQIIIDDAKLIKEKYGNKRKRKLTRYSSEFKGYVKFGEWGIINFFDQEDMINILSSRGWGTIEKSVHFYNKNENRFIVKGNRLIPMVNPSREITCTNVVCCPANNNGLTLVVNKNGNTAVIEKEIPDNNAGWSIFPISRNFYAIHRDGKITKEVYTDYSIRKTVSCGAKTDIVYALPNNSKNIVVFYMHTSEPNTLRSSLILHDGVIGNLATVSIGELVILGVYSLRHKEVCLNIPSSCTKSSAIEFLIIKNIETIFADGKSNQFIDLNKSSNIAKRLTRDKQVRTLWVLE